MKCANCRFFVKNFSSEKSRNSKGRCHRYPPTLLEPSSINIISSVEESWAFPLIRGDGFCGEFSLKVPK